MTKLPCSPQVVGVAVAECGGKGLEKLELMSEVLVIAAEEGIKALSYDSAGIADALATPGKEDDDEGLIKAPAEPLCWEVGFRVSVTKVVLLLCV